jgi:hypothetical protein
LDHHTDGWSYARPKSSVLVDRAADLCVSLAIFSFICFGIREGERFHVHAAQGRG